MRRVTIWVLSGLVGLVLFLVLCTFRARPYEMAMLDRFGSLREPAKIMYGWYLKWPTDRVVLLDSRLHLYQSTLNQLVTAGSDTISVRAFAAWRINDKKAFYRSTAGSDETAQQFIDTKVTAEVGAVLARHRLEELFNTDEKKVVTSQLENEVRDAINEKMKQAGQGIEVAQVGFSRMAFPPALASKVYDRMTAERMIQAQKFESEGANKAKEIQALADRDASNFRAEADRKGQDIRGQGDAEALQILAKAQTQEAMDFYRFWREIELFKNSIGKGTYLILRSNMSVADQLFQAGKEGSGLGGAPTTRPSAVK